jgi:hypothetical protein
MMPHFPELRKHLEKARAIAGKNEVFVVDRQHTNIAMRHYLLVTEADFAKAACEQNDDAEEAKKRRTLCAKSGAARVCTRKHSIARVDAKC